MTEQALLDYIKYLVEAKTQLELALIQERLKNNEPAKSDAKSEGARAA